MSNKISNAMSLELKFFSKLNERLYRAVSVDLPADRHAKNLKVKKLSAVYFLNLSISFCSVFNKDNLSVPSGGTWNMSIGNTCPENSAKYQSKELYTLLKKGRKYIIQTRSFERLVGLNSPNDPIIGNSFLSQCPTYSSHNCLLK